MHMAEHSEPSLDGGAQKLYGSLYKTTKWCTGFFWRNAINPMEHATILFHMLLISVRAYTLVSCTAVVQGHNTAMCIRACRKNQVFATIPAILAQL